ncbi:MAG: NADH:ubiquinone oxidoreductase subunit 2 (chain N), partial [Haloquadratum sp. J07HQX50]
MNLLAALQMTEPSALVALSPVVILGLSGLLLLTMDAIGDSESRPRLLAGIATVGSVTAFSVAGGLLLRGVGQTRGSGAISLYGGALTVDGVSLFFILIFTIVTAMVVVASYDYLKGKEHQTEFYSLVLFAATGLALMASANSLATVFISLELASLPSYALVTFLKSNRGNVEAGLKYFLIGAVSSAVFVFGVSLVFATTGSLQLQAVAAQVSTRELGGLLGMGILFMIGGFAFKTASVPFHFWAPEAYEGAPAPISAFLSSASKAGGFAVGFRVFVEAFPLAQ